jgi:hypothetical protein
MRLYCTVDGLPPQIKGPISGEVLAEAFTSLTESGWVREIPSNANVQGTGVWLEVVASVTRRSPYLYDMEKGKAVAKTVGFSTGS